MLVITPSVTKILSIIVEPEVLMSLSVPITVLYVPDACLPSSAVCNPSTFEITWLWLSSATVTVSVALPRLVNVALPDASPESVNVGSAVAVVAMDTLPKLVIVPEPVTAPVSVTVGSDVAVVAILILPEPSKLALPVTAPVTAILRAVANVLAVLALPLRAAVTVPALKLPEASRATTLDAVLLGVASTLSVGVEPSPDVPPVR